MEKGIASATNGNNLPSSEQIRSHHYELCSAPRAHSKSSSIEDSDPQIQRQSNIAASECQHVQQGRGSSAHGSAHHDWDRQYTQGLWLDTDGTPLLQWLNQEPQRECWNAVAIVPLLGLVETRGSEASVADVGNDWSCVAEGSLNAMSKDATVQEIMGEIETETETGIERSDTDLRGIGHVFLREI
jgi:hypothetical protein